MNAAEPRMQPASEFTTPRPDERDAGILTAFYAARVAKIAAQPVPAPLEGDWLRMPGGDLLRVAHSHPGFPADRHGPALAATVQPCEGGSFALSRSGAVSMSGSLGSGIRADRLTLETDADGAPVTEEAAVWFFHHDHWKAHNSVHAWIPVRVWLVHPEGGAI